MKRIKCKVCGQERKRSETVPVYCNDRNLGRVCRRPECSAKKAGRVVRGKVGLEYVPNSKA